MDVFITYHPAAVLHGARKGPEYAANLEQYIRDDLIKLKSYQGTLPYPENIIPSPSSILSLDTEYDGETCLTIGLSDGKAAHAWEVSDECTEPAHLLESITYLIGHNTPRDIDMAIESGVLPLREEFIDGSCVIDTLIVARMVDENRMSYELENLLSSLFPVKPWKFKTKGGKKNVSSTPEVQSPEEAEGQL